MKIQQYCTAVFLYIYSSFRHNKYFMKCLAYSLLEVLLMPQEEVNTSKSYLLQLAWSPIIFNVKYQDM